MLVLATLGCGGDADQPAGGGDDGAGPDPRRHHQPPVPVAVDRATSGDIASHYSATATLAAAREAEILARIGGVVGSLHCEEGDLVERGRVLLRIDNDEYGLRLAQAEANTANLTARHTRRRRVPREPDTRKPYRLSGGGLLAGCWYCCVSRLSRPSSPVRRLAAVRARLLRRGGMGPGRQVAARPVDRAPRD